MSVISPRLTAGQFSTSGIEQLKRSSPKDLESEKARLRKATKEFESFFNYYMLKTMRKTIPEDDSMQGLLSNDNSKDIFSDIFDSELARMMSTGRYGSISEMLYKSMEKLVEAEYSQDSIRVPLRNLNSTPEPIELAPSEFRSITRETTPLKLNREKSSPMPLKQRTGVRARSPEEIARKYGRHIEEAARDNDLDPALLISMIKAESNGDEKAVSSAGAKGLMQLIDSTADEVGVRDVFDPRENISGGARYFRTLLDRFGDTKLALAAYNAGPGNVIKYGGIPPFDETRGYVAKVMDTLETIHGASSHGAKAAERFVDKIVTGKPRAIGND